MEHIGPVELSGTEAQLNSLFEKLLLGSVEPEEYGVPDWLILPPDKSDKEMCLLEIQLWSIVYLGIIYSESDSDSELLHVKI